MEPVQHRRPQFTEEELAAQAAELAARRAEWARIEEQNKLWKRALLLVGPPLRDVEAAMECMDSCHPQLRMEQHDGGATCHCQDTPEQKEQRRRDARAALREMTELWQPSEEEVAEAAWLKEAFERIAGELGVDLKSWGGSVPFQIEGTFENRSFYVRARHERFTIRVAPVEDPAMFLRDPHDWGDGDWTIDDGPDETLFGGRQQDEVYALRYVVDKIKTFLHPPAPCPHILSNEAGTIRFEYCPLCGYLLEHIVGKRP
jgi:hypothetical protein